MQVDSNDVPGVVLGEIYDADEVLDRSSLSNIATRGQAAAGEDAIISGFVVSGKGPTRVLVRGVGPALESFGIAGSLADPVLRIHQGSVLIAENDNWETPRPVAESQRAASAHEVVDAALQAGAFPIAAGSKDAAVLIILAPGTYTATLSGASNTGGVGLLEIYPLPNN
jgi:hypothetical protein